MTAMDAKQAAAQHDPPQGVRIGAAIWGALSPIVAFQLGGWVAGWTAAVFDRKWGALNGALVFVVAVPATLLLAGLGLGTLLGALGSFAGARSTLIRVKSRERFKGRPIRGNKPRPRLSQRMWGSRYRQRGRAVGAL